ncbi:MAG TPA: hypothetical protein VG986_19135 [Pseudolabrys sp.]|nr:hypothetical protein [Pseudolabrys sp.]
MNIWPFSHHERDRCGVLVGDGAFVFPIVGESHYQGELETICGGKTSEGARDRHAALLLPEPNNPYDRHAVCVKIFGKTVGYLSRDVAPDFLQALGRTEYREIASEAIVVGGWHRRGGQDGFFGVRLNAAMPFEFIAAQEYFRKKEHSA